MKLPVVSGKEVTKALQKAGFGIVRQKGSHIHLAKRDAGSMRHVTVPVHGNKDLNPFVIRSIMRQAGFSVEELCELLK